jgi:hypothetical protein
VERLGGELAVEEGVGRVVVFAASLLFEDRGRGGGDGRGTVLDELESERIERVSLEHMGENTERGVGRDGGKKQARLGWPEVLRFGRGVARDLDATLVLNRSKLRSQ